MSTGILTTRSIFLNGVWQQTIYKLKRMKNNTVLV